MYNSPIRFPPGFLKAVQVILFITSMVTMFEYIMFTILIGCFYGLRNRRLLKNGKMRMKLTNHLPQICLLARMMTHSRMFLMLCYFVLIKLNTLYLPCYFYCILKYLHCHSVLHCHKIIHCHNNLHCHLTLALYIATQPLHWHTPFTLA